MRACVRACVRARVRMCAVSRLPECRHEERHLCAGDEEGHEEEQEHEGQQRVARAPTPAVGRHRPLTRPLGRLRGQVSPHTCAVRVVLAKRESERNVLRTTRCDMHVRLGH